MLKILFQPYPLSEKSFGQIFGQSIFEGIFIALFLIIIQPFGISNWEISNKSAYLFAYGIVTALCVLVIKLVVHYKYASYNEQAGWTVWKEILALLILLLLISICNYVLTIKLFHLNFNFSGLASMFLMVTIIGIFPIVFGVMLNYIYQLKKYEKPIVVSHSKSDQTPITDNILKLIADNEKDTIELNAENLFYIESADNYSTVLYEKEGKLQKELLRSSLTRLETQISNNSIVRCHRSFIVNLDNVQKVTGNAQGYKLNLKSVEFQVPVARKYSEIVNNLKLR
jgi:LytTr DNA-binding domain